MPDEEPPHGSEIDEVSARLNDALKSCRSVVANYKALLATDKKGIGGIDAADSGESGSAHPAVPDAAVGDET